MPLQIGDQNATIGMSRDIFQELENQLSNGMEPEEVEKVRPSWRRLAFAVATGVITHITANMEISGIESAGDVETTIQGTVNVTDVTGTGTGTANTTQTGLTTGHVS